MNYDIVLDLFINQAIKLNILDVDNGSYHCGLYGGCNTCPITELPKPHWCNYDGRHFNKLNDYLKLHHPELFI